MRKDLVVPHQDLEGTSDLLVLEIDEFGTILDRVLDELLGIELDVEQIVGVVTIVVAWVIGDSVRPTE